MRNVAIYIFLPISIVGFFWTIVGLYMMVNMPEFGFRWGRMDYEELVIYAITGIVYAYFTNMFLKESRSNGNK